MPAQELTNEKGTMIKEAATTCSEIDNSDSQPVVSFLSEVPEPLQAAIATFIELHPNWDQYRLIQAALAGFLVQNGVDSRSVTRLYLDNMFSCKSFGQDI